MWRNTFYFLLGAVTAGLIAWTIPSSCEYAVTTVQNAVEAAPGLVDAARGAFSTE